MHYVDGAVTPLGLALSGEVEDYLYTIHEVDYGDAGSNGNPSVDYPTMRDPDDGARHVIDRNGPFLGTYVDHDMNGTPSTNADADDLTGLPDDEDGTASPRSSGSETPTRP